MKLFQLFKLLIKSQLLVCLTLHLPFLALRLYTVIHFCPRLCIAATVGTPSFSHCQLAKVLSSTCNPLQDIALGYLRWQVCHSQTYSGSPPVTPETTPPSWGELKVV